MFGIRYHVCSFLFASHFWYNNSNFIESVCEIWELLNFDLFDFMFPASRNRRHGYWLIICATRSIDLIPIHVIQMDVTMIRDVFGLIAIFMTGNTFNSCFYWCFISRFEINIQWFFTCVTLKSKQCMFAFVCVCVQISMHKRTKVRLTLNYYDLHFANHWIFGFYKLSFGLNYVSFYHLFEKLCYKIC